MTDNTGESNHTFLKDRMAGRRGWFKTFVLAVSSLIMISMLAGNLLQSF
ncbi:hypothetical protein [Cohaesibacter celericrescens]|nr:hypothetical protein [Cohaesibacter celericrescens]